MLTAPHRSRSARRMQVKGCFSKRQYRDHIQACHRAKAWGQRVYQCEMCGYWHLTTQRTERGEGAD